MPVRVLPEHAVADAAQCAKDLNSFEYREQIIAARKMQTLGAAAAPHAAMLANRLEDENFQMRRACAETIRLLADLAKDMALDAAEAAKEAEKAARQAEEAMALREAEEAARQEEYERTGVRPPSKKGSRSGSKRAAGSRVGSKDEAGYHLQGPDGPVAPSGSRSSSKLQAPDSAAGSRRPSKQSSRRPSKMVDTLVHGPGGSRKSSKLSGGSKGSRRNSEWDIDISKGPPALPGSRMGSKQLPDGDEGDKVHSAGWFSGKDHDEHEDEGEEKSQRPGSKQSRRASFEDEGDLQGLEGLERTGSQPGSKAGSRPTSRGSGRPEEGRPQTRDSSATARSASGGPSWVSSESSESEEEVITPRTAAAMADPRSAIAPFVPQLAKALQDKTWQVRLSSSRALAAIAGEEVAQGPIMDAIAELVSKEEHDEVREACVEVYEALGADAGPHADTCMLALRDRAEGVRAQAIKALGAMGRSVPSRCKHMPALATLMKDDPCDEVRVQAAKAIARNGKTGLLYLDGLLERVTDDPSVWVQHAALHTLINLGTPATAHIFKLIHHDSREIQRTAVHHLALGLLDLMESSSESRRPFITAKTTTKTEAQKQWFVERSNARKKARRDARAARDEAGRKKAAEMDRIYITPDNSSDSGKDTADSQKPKDDFDEESNQDLDNELISYIEAIAAKLLSDDESMRQLAIECLRKLQVVEDPHPGRQMLAWQEGRWTSRNVKDLL